MRDRIGRGRQRRVGERRASSGARLFEIEEGLVDLDRSFSGVDWMDYNVLIDTKEYGRVEQVQESASTEEVYLLSGRNRRAEIL